MLKISNYSVLRRALIDTHILIISIVFGDVTKEALAILLLKVS